MNHSRYTQLVLLAVVTLMLAIAATGWWLSSPEAAASAGMASVILVTAVCGVRECRRGLPSRSPVVLCTTLVGLGVVVFVKPTGLLFPTAVGVVVALAWTSVLVARVRDRMSVAKLWSVYWHSSLAGGGR